MQKYAIVAILLLSKMRHVHFQNEQMNLVMSIAYIIKES